MAKHNLTALTLIFLFTTASCLALNPLNVYATSPKTITVPDNYPTIQEAISHACDGDTVFVKSGTYNSTMQSPIDIDKPLSLVGEDASSTIIQQTGSFYPTGGRSAVALLSDYITVSGFTVIESTIGISIGTYNKIIYGCNVTGNIITHCGEGLSAGNDYGSIISNNNITGGYNGIRLFSSDSISICENNISAYRANGITAKECKNVTITRNSITDGKKSTMTDPGTIALQGGINLGTFGPHYVYENSITGNQGYGIQFASGCAYATVHHNNISQNEVGIKVKNFAFYSYLTAGDGNVVYSNNLVDNAQNAFVEKAFPYNLSDVEHATGNGTDSVRWDNGKEGNYWSDYFAKYPNAKEGTSGTGDTAYVIDTDNIDRKPLLKMATAAESDENPLSATEFPFWVMPPLCLVAILLLAIFIKKVKGQQK